MKYLIIGQGLAGTLIGFRLERAGHDVHYHDAPDQVAASSVAAGIVNPITGRRFVKSWRIEELTKEARDLYGDLEVVLTAKFWHDLPLVRTLFNRGDQNDWLVRSGDDGYAEYLNDHPDLENLPDLTLPAFAYAGVRQSARVDVGLLVNLFRDKIITEGRFTAHTSTDELSPDTYDRTIYCEGWRARFNPLWIYLPHGGNKGEVLIIRTAAPPLRLMYKHRVFLVPLAEPGTYWVGATSENDLSDPHPTPRNHTQLLDRLGEIITVPFEVIEHRAAVRPTTKDRRMLIGVHPKQGDRYIFNGLGTKGASLAPMGSKWLYDYLKDETPVPEEVSIDRFLLK